MSVRQLMLEELARGLRLIRGGGEVVPTWRIVTPDGDFVIGTRLDHDEEQQQKLILTLVPCFMRWKMATAFVLTLETWLGLRMESGEGAVLAVGVSDAERWGVMRRIQRVPYFRFQPLEWLHADQLDDTFFTLLPSGENTVTGMEEAELVAIFGAGGVLPAKRILVGDLHLDVTL